MHPVLYQFGPLQIRFYGLMYVVAILVGTSLIKSEVRRRTIRLTDEEVMNFILWTVVGGIVGARIYYVLFNWSYYSRYPLEMPALWHGGLAIHGGLIGGATIAYIYLKKRKISYWLMSDIVAPAIILGQTFGRFGNFMNGDAHGVPTTMPWGIIFPADSIAGRQFPGIPTHPTMLYEMSMNFLIFIFLWLYVRKKPHKNGFIFALYIGLYSAIRFFVEHFRADSLMFGHFRAAQIVSVIGVVLSCTVILRWKLWTKEGAQPR